MSLLLPILIFFGFFISQIIKVEYEDSIQTFLFCTALGSVFASIVFTILTFLGWVHPATAWLFLAGVYVAGLSRTIHISISNISRVNCKIDPVGILCF